MPGTVHGGSLGRWFEELCRIKVQPLRKIVALSENKLIPRSLPNEGGVYVFWWIGDVGLLRSENCNRLLELPGPSKRPVSFEIDDEWLGLSTNLPIPLYVGKNADSIAKRVGSHLLLGQKRVLPLGGGSRKAERPTTSCQLRAGVEHLFPNEIDTRSLVLNQIGFSYVILHGDEQAANRFYLEDLTIGLMRPPLNIDIER